ncbi:MAG TPA: hexitol phosphatase HxpB [Chitinophagales bacterium]|nr:hexitol phosphatase HxpB [Chitinophagales bacterium]
MFDAVIYDMDGLIIDSEPFWRQAEMKVFATVGLNLTEADCMQTTGFRFDEVVEHWWHRQPWQGKTKEQIHDEVLDEMENAITHHAEAMKGFKASVGYFKNKKLKMAVASSSAMRLIKATVKKLEVENYFDMLVSAEHETHGKPHPAVFIRTAEMLKVRPENCLVIEDSFNGLLAAKAAKMKCAVIPYPEDYHNPKLVIADWKLNSLEEIRDLELL